MLTLGRYQLAALLDGTFALDGGAIFGVVPRPLWERRMTPDARNRVQLAARCLLAVDASARRRILVDVGLGGSWDARSAERYAIDRSGGDLTQGLARLGLTRGEVTDVVLTHLHFDHAGGVTVRGAGGALELAFPNAVHHLQRRNWQWAHAPTDRDQASYQPASFEVLEHSGRLHLVDGEVELFPDLQLVVSDGHTVAQQLPRFHGDGTHLTCCADVVPTLAHLRVPWIMACDLYPLTTLDEKKMLLAQVLEDDGILFFGHEPGVAACRLQEEEGHPAFREAVPL